MRILVFLLPSCSLQFATLNKNFSSPAAAAGGGEQTPQSILSKLTSADISGTGYFGRAVAISADGFTAVIGAPADNSNIGGTSVFQLVNGVWTQQGSKLLADDYLGPAGQGSAVAISADGNTLAVGGPTDNTVGPTIIGAVWIFVKSNGEWIQQGSKLIGTGMVGIGQGFFGSAVALSADGNTVIIGATGDNYWRGSAWVYKRTNGVWTQDGNKITPNDGTARASFGSAVSLSANGLKLFVGAANDATGYGAIWAFTQNSSSNWIQGGPKITFANSTGNSNIGAAMSVSANADRILVGGPLDNGGLGTAWVLRR